MKAKVDSKNWKITLDNEAVKAIRFCYGVNTNLRKHLDIPRDDLWYWIDQNRFGLFGSVMSDLKPHPTSDDWDKYESMINDVVFQIVR